MEIGPAKRLPRLNPFVFPSNTDFQFVLLILTLIGAIIFIYNELYLSLGNNRDIRKLMHEQCLKTNELPLALGDYEKMYIRNTNYIHCVAGFERARILWIFAGLSFVSITASLIYLWSPKWKILHDHLESLNPEDAPEVVTYTLSLCSEINLSRNPTLLWNPTNFAISGVAFGRLGQYYLSLTAGLVKQFYDAHNRPRFRAIVLHELAHLQNADIDKTYFAVAIWLAFAINIFIILPLILLNERADIILGWSWRALALILMVYLLRNAVLRSRELYADVRASVWNADVEVLISIVETHPRHDNIFQTLRSVHPNRAERLEVLAEPHRLLLNFGGWDFF